ncbi:MAG: peptide-methionine (S)-S-oxide reductase MsrA [Bacilli bacterium]
MKVIHIAGGCFWGVEEFYKRLPGVINTKVGYINSLKEDVTYQEVCSGVYQAIEGVCVEYDEKIISLNTILEYLFKIIDPTSQDRQGNDIGISYRVGLYYIDEVDYKVALSFVNQQKPFYNKEIVFEIKPLLSFCDAEDYHQLYLRKNPNGYCHVDFSILEGIK